jgi:hypothetical protein
MLFTAKAAVSWSTPTLTHPEGGDGRTLPEKISNAITRDFGLVERWRQEFIALAEALASDAGWILLSYVPRDGRLINQSASDHTQGIAGGIPILALDMYEHAYHIEYGANTTAYIAAFMRNIDRLRSRRGMAMRSRSPRPGRSRNRNSRMCHQSPRRGAGEARLRAACADHRHAT